MFTKKAQNKKLVNCCESWCLHLLFLPITCFHFQMHFSHCQCLCLFVIICSIGLLQITLQEATFRCKFQASICCRQLLLGSRRLGSSYLTDLSMHVFSNSIQSVLTPFIWCRSVFSKRIELSPSFMWQHKDLWKMWRLWTSFLRKKRNLKSHVCEETRNFTRLQGHPYLCNW